MYINEYLILFTALFLLRMMLLMFNLPGLFNFVTKMYDEHGELPILMGISIILGRAVMPAGITLVVYLVRILIG